jgi:hypothetical protein
MGAECNARRCVGPFANAVAAQLQITDWRQMRETCSLIKRPIGKATAGMGEASRGPCMHDMYTVYMRVAIEPIPIGVNEAQLHIDR